MMIEKETVYKIMWEVFYADEMIPYRGGLCEFIDRVYERIQEYNEPERARIDEAALSMIDAMGAP